MIKHILIIEDEVLIQQTLKKLLQRQGHTVVSCSTGQEAIDLIRIEKFDRIICDLMLQDISGFDIIEESKKVFTSKIIAEKFVIITAYNSEHILTKAKSYGCRIINKPFENLDDALRLMVGPL